MLRISLPHLLYKQFMFERVTLASRVGFCDNFRFYNIGRISKVGITNKHFTSDFSSAASIIRNLIKNTFIRKPVQSSSLFI